MLLDTPRFSRELPSGCTLRAVKTALDPREITQPLAGCFAVVAGAQPVRVRSGPWRDDLRFTELRSLTVGIIGFGQIGQALARLLAPFGVTIRAHDLVPQPHALSGVTFFDSLHEMLPGCHVLSVHLALTDETLHLIGAEELATLSPGAIVISGLSIWLPRPGRYSNEVAERQGRAVGGSASVPGLLRGPRTVLRVANPRTQRPSNAAAHARKAHVDEMDKKPL